MRLVDNADGQIARALGQVRQNILQFVEFGLISEPAEQVMDRIEGVVTTDMVAAVEGCGWAEPVVTLRILVYVMHAE